MGGPDRGQHPVPGQAVRKRKENSWLATLRKWSVLKLHLVAPEAIHG